MIALYADHMQQIRALTLGRARVREIVLSGLARITAALAAGDSDAAADAVLEHLRQARLAFIDALGLQSGRQPGVRGGRRHNGKAPR
jgi:DNA-binding GntR family transcriptional regulator